MAKRTVLNCAVVNAVFSTHRLENKIFKCANAKCTFTCERDVNGARDILLRAEQELVFCSALRLNSLTVGSSESPVMQSASVNVEVISIPFNDALTRRNENCRFRYWIAIRIE